MIDFNNLPDAWATVETIFSGKENSDSLYDIYYQISSAIFRYREKYNMSQKQLAEKLGVTQAMVSKLESGDYNYTIEQLWKVATKLNFDLAIKFAEKEEDSLMTVFNNDQGPTIDNEPVFSVAA
ncbi:MAG: helix-turn-helix transcriptional regulator [Peptococcaceae bacterium]|jgi:transcriptional regulator with XRE-family HTH domain|nr:helix-turn-helix transcriptional regulator [Peptococcaceae bacterium]MDH7525859.1 helix-turn-helix transcriptional regulator [Peptococcaceae bacterium]